MSITTKRPEVRELLMKMVQEKLALCTPDQQAFFNKLYPKGIKHFQGNTFDTALSQIELTIKKNEAKALMA